ncbi:MAG: hypothetical protein A3A61_01895 [Candidatus Woykebacteria bacterium RIFCSPLOWO2_01_FULL_43_14]|uniref:Addiction module toxin RelE n=1 Tax=Candidatus Woykebacteria bacterium RIFCSPLOWO2_01_FULL_43_14 TaxID=1802605 RepID=A0A1G1WTA1_9BACT|nr:MAG: hypothetical protein A3A61_01895 [Candidatus Woykebacteria bacterium RIFCSPLOWO2_01_FULL_43_14]
MPAKLLVVEKPVRKQLLKLPTSVHVRIIKALDAIKSNPVAGSKLKGQLGSYYKYRMGDYRIIYLFDTKQSIVSVVKIENRQGVYK